MEQNNVPTIESLYNVNNTEEINNFIKKHKLPIIIKAASGGGGKGMKVVFNESEISESISLAKKEP